MDNCKRCGKCCMEVGSTFWTHGDYEQWPDLQKKAENIEIGGDDAMPCQMLLVLDSKATCLLQRNRGAAAKPRVCREHPEDGELCQHEKAFGPKDVTKELF